MTRLRRAAASAGAAWLLAVATASSARAQTPPETAPRVYVVKPGRTALKAEPRVSAPGRGTVAYGQKLALRKREGDWMLVAVPGEAQEGWIFAKAVVDHRPGLDAVPVGDALDRVVASESTSTAGAIRGLDGRTAGYASAKRIPPAALEQLARLEGQAERLFQDRHRAGPGGVWPYPDTTVLGRYAAASRFARELGLRVPKPARRKGPVVAPPPSATPTPSPEPSPSSAAP